MQKRFILFVISTLACLFAYQKAKAQPRVDGGTSVNVIKSSPVVTNFIGWAYDETTEKWCGYYNTLYAKYRNNNKTPRRMVPDDMAFFDNVVSLQIKKVKYEGETYYLLLSARYEGRYEYPTIEEGWYSKKVTDMYVLSSEEYSKMKSLSTGITTIFISAHTTYGGFPIGYFDDFSTALLNIFKENEKFSQHNFYKLYVKKENERTYRFQKITHLDLDLGEKSSYYKRPNYISRRFQTVLEVLDRRHSSRPNHCRMSYTRGCESYQISQKARPLQQQLRCLSPLSC